MTHDLSRDRQSRRSPGRRGRMLVIVSGPSGVGKDTVIDVAVPGPDRAASATSSSPAPPGPRREYEVDGVHYHFLDHGGVRAAREAGGFLEANLVHGHWYGTPRDAGPRRRSLAGRDAILKIDVQGAAVVKQKVPEALLVFLVPPSLEDLFARLQARATETADELDIRQRNAALELARQEDYDYVVLNETGQVARTAAARRRDHPRREGRPPGPSHPGLSAVTARRGSSRSRSTRRAPRAMRAYTYAVPAALERLEPGEAVLVEFGRRQALAIVLGAGRRVAGVETKPILDRVRADGPLLPELAMRLAAWIAEHYLAPPAITLRAMLPPGLLERLELVAERRPGRGATPSDAATPGDAGAAATERCGRRDPRGARGRPAPVRPRRAGGPAALLRRLRALEARGPRRPRLDAARRRRRPAIGCGRRPGDRGRRGGVPRERRGEATAASGARSGRGRTPLLEDLAAAPPDGLPAPELAARHGSVGGGQPRAPRPRRRSTSARRRGARSRPAPPGAREPPGRARAQPRAGGGRRRGRAAAAPGGAPTAPPRRRDRRRQDGDLRRARSRGRLARGRPALVLVPEIALALPARRPAAGGPRRPRRPRPQRPRRRRASGRVAPDPARRRRRRRRHPPGRARAARRRRPRSSSTRSTTPPTRATGRRGSRPATWRSSSGRLAGAPVVLGSATPSVETEGRARRARSTAAPPARRASAARRRRSRSSTSGPSSRRATSGCCRARLARRDRRARRGSGDQAILVINRRGTASVVLCRDCGYVATCPDCTRPLVFHQAGADAALPPLRPRVADAGALPAVRLGADPLPRRRHGAGRARGPGPLPGAARRAARPGRRGAQGRRGEGHRRVRRRAPRRPRRHEPRHEGPRHPGRDARRRSSRPTSRSNLPDERAAERTYQLLAQAVGRAGRGDRPGPRDHPDLPAGAPGDRRGRRGARRGVLRRRAGPPAAVRVAALRPAREADGRRWRTATRPRRPAEGCAERLRERSGSDRGAGSRSPGPRRRSSPAAAIGGASTSCSAGDDPVGAPGRPAGRAVVGRRRSRIAPVSARQP